jgi:reactive chlorine resistance protein C
MKFTSYEAHGNAPLIDHSPIMSWMNVLFGVRGASDVIGTIEFATAAALILGAFVPAASAVGPPCRASTFLITLTFFVSAPGVAESTAGGFPAISAPIGQVLLKDLVLLAASINLLLASLRSVSKQTGMSTEVTPRMGRSSILTESKQVRTYSDSASRGQACGAISLEDSFELAQSPSMNNLIMTRSTSLSGGPKRLSRLPAARMPDDHSERRRKVP